MYLLDARRGIKEVLGIPPEALPKVFMDALDEAVERETLILSPGARLLQGVVLQDTPFGQGDRMRMRLRGMAVFISALESVGQAWSGESKELQQDVKPSPSDAKAPPSRPSRSSGSR
jgi:hypothetical protein